MKKKEAIVAQIFGLCFIDKAGWGYEISPKPFSFVNYKHLSANKLKCPKWL